MSLKLGIALKENQTMLILFQRLKHMILEAFMEKKGKKMNREVKIFKKRCVSQLIYKHYCLDLDLDFTTVLFHVRK